MSGRTKNSTVKLMSEFTFAEYEGTLPPGEYSLTENEELIEGVSWLAYRRTATYIQVPAIGRGGLSCQLFKIGQEELTAIVEHDAALELQKTSSEHSNQAENTNVRT